MRAKVAVALLSALALSLPAAVPAKGFSRVVLVGADGRWVDVRGSETAIDRLLGGRGAVAEPRGGYLRLFFVGPGDFPANPARYYPAARCVALDWPQYETSCRRVDAAVLRPTSRLTRFPARPTVLSRVFHAGYIQAGTQMLRGPLELAFARRGREAPQPARCYSFAGSWRGAAASRRPRAFFVCKDGAYAAGRLHPLGRGPWDWLRLNAGPPS